MIVKVTLPDASSATALIRDKEGKVHFSAPASRVLAAKMNGATARFFSAEIDDKTKVFELGDAVVDQDW